MHTTTKFKTMHRVPFLLSLTASLLLLPLLSGCGKSLSSAALLHLLETPTQTSSASLQQVDPRDPSVEPKTAPTQTSSASLQQVDWSNFTYVFTCYTDEPAIVKVTNGSAHQGFV
jgi:hypothetical protein